MTHLTEQQELWFSVDWPQQHLHQSLGARGQQLSMVAAAVSSPDTSKGPFIRRPTLLGLALTLAGLVGRK